MATFRVRQKYVHYEDFVVDADTAEEAVEEVGISGNGDGEGLEYLDTLATYVVGSGFDDANFGQALEEQPDNAFGVEESE